MLKKFTTYMSRNWVKVYFAVALACIVFAYGVIVGAYKVFPFSTLAGAVGTFKHYRTQMKNEFPGLTPARYKGEGAVVNKEGLTYPGVTLIAIPWHEGDDWLQSLRLVDMEGKTLHKWTVEPEAVWSESPHQDLMRGTKSTKLGTHIHGSVLLPGGDVVFNLSHYGLLRLNACSEIVWKVPYRAHHSVHMDEYGNFWAPGEIWHDKPIEKFPGFSTPFVEDTIIKVSPSGEIIREISILESIYRSGYEGLLFSSGRHKFSGDATHNNDVEVLESRLSADFEGLNAGDIMVSLRNISTVLIIDGETELVKWALQHPFVLQHDPDFVEGGFISVLDNRPNMEGNAPAFEGSRIVRVRPFSNEVEIIYASSADNNFYTRGGGKHQNLPNGNLLIGEPYAGRLFEVTRDGELVWSWLAERWSDGDIRVPELSDGSRYPKDFGNFPKDCL